MPRIPLFPLNVVLFPGFRLPLHIFEPRYRLMLKHCLESHAEFGVVLQSSHAIEEIGCTAEIISVLKNYPDGRSDIVTMGRRVFRILEVVADKPYLEAEIEYLQDEPDTPSQAEVDLATKLYAECQIALQTPDWVWPGARFPLDRAYFMASGLPLPLEAKQEVLAQRSASARLLVLIEHMQILLSELQELQRRRKAAKGNGRVKPNTTLS